MRTGEGGPFWKVGMFHVVVILRGKTKAHTSHTQTENLKTEDRNLAVLIPCHVLRTYVR